MISQYLNALKEAKGLTRQQLADKSGVSLSTVERVLSGKAKNASFDVLRALTFALEGTLDDLSAAVDSTPGINPETYGAGPVLPSTPEGAREVATSADINRMTDAFLTALQDKDDACSEQLRLQSAAHKEEIAHLNERYAADKAALDTSYMREIRTKDDWIKGLSILSVVLGAALLMVLTLDILNPFIG